MATPAQAASIANYFNNNYAAMVFAGQIRENFHSPLLARLRCAPGTGVNGGYWGVAAGQFANALKRANPTLSKQTLLDLVNFYKAKNDVPEYTNPGGKWGAHRRTTRRSSPLVQFKRYMLSPRAGPSVDEGNLERRDGRRLGCQRRHAFRRELA